MVCHSEALWFGPFVPAAPTVLSLCLLGFLALHLERCRDSVSGWFQGLYSDRRLCGPCLNQLRFPHRGGPVFSSGLCSSALELLGSHGFGVVPRRTSPNWGADTPSQDSGGVFPFCVCVPEGTPPRSLGSHKPCTMLARLLIWAGFPVYCHFCHFLINILILIETILEESN